MERYLLFSSPKVHRHRFLAQLTIVVFAEIALYYTFRIPNQLFQLPHRTRLTNDSVLMFHEFFEFFLEFLAQILLCIAIIFFPLYSWTGTANWHKYESPLIIACVLCNEWPVNAQILGQHQLYIENNMRHLSTLPLHLIVLWNIRLLLNKTFHRWEKWKLKADKMIMLSHLACLKVSDCHYRYLRSLPVFLTGNGNDSWKVTVMTNFYFYNTALNFTKKNMMKVTNY